jgi:hypothetical protein
MVAKFHRDTRRYAAAHRKKMIRGDTLEVSAWKDAVSRDTRARCASQIFAYRIAPISIRWGDDTRD